MLPKKKSKLLMISLVLWLKMVQSVYTILNNHPEITQCEKTIYNYIDAGVFSIEMDLQRK